mgnify:CR=1 FL=1
MTDIDGIPQSSQKPGVAYHDPLVPGAPGHGDILVGQDQEFVVWGVVCWSIHKV